jgi:hypothetical protein
MSGNHGGVRLQHRDAPANDAARPHAEAAAGRETDHQVILPHVST